MPKCDSSLLVTFFVPYSHLMGGKRDKHLEINGFEPSPFATEGIATSIMQ